MCECVGCNTRALAPQTRDSESARMSQHVMEVGRVQSHGSPFSLEDSLGRLGRTCQGTLYEVDWGNTSNILRP